jgi:hypothetical protein
MDGHMDSLEGLRSCSGGTKRLPHKQGRQRKLANPAVVGAHLLVQNEGELILSSRTIIADCGESGNALWVKMLRKKGFSR